MRHHATKIGVAFIRERVFVEKKKKTRNYLNLELMSITTPVSIYIFFIHELDDQYVL